MLEFKFGNDLPYSIYFDENGRTNQGQFGHLCFVVIIEFCKFEVILIFLNQVKLYDG